MLTEIFYHVDNFCKEFESYLKTQTISTTASGLIKRRDGKMSLSDIMTILIYFHHSGYRNFKKYYKECASLKGAFDEELSYNRFVEIERNGLIPLAVFMHLQSQKHSTGINYIDSAKIQVCHNLRISRNKVFTGMAQRGKTSTGWFYGFKLHLIVNEYGEIVSFMITPGNIADNNIAVVKKLTKNCFGKLWGDRGYISEKLFKELYSRGVKLITRIKKNMKNKLMDFQDKVMLNKRGIIETVIGALKATCQIEHSRHRSPINFFVNLVSGLVAYTFLPKKPTLRGRFKPILTSDS